MSLFAWATCRITNKSEVQNFVKEDSKMRPGKWWSVILVLGLLMALSPLSAQAGPRRPFAAQPNRQAFTPPQCRGNACSWNSQPHQWQQPRGNAFGWNGQNRQWQQPHGNAYGWNRQPQQWQQPRGNAYGRNDYQRQWGQQRGAYGWNGQNRQGQQPAINAYGSNDHQRQWQQPGPSTAQGDRSGNQQVQPANWGQHNNTGSSYNRAGYPAQTQSPNTTPGWSGYNHNATMPASQSGTQPVSSPTPAGNTSQPAGQTPSGSI